MNESAGSIENMDDNYPLIGFLTESVSGVYQSKIWIGASDTAKKKAYGLVCFAGGSLNASSWDPYEPQRNAIYNLIDTKRLKGLIVSGSLGSFISVQEFESFCSKFKDIPLVCIGPETHAYPSVVFDNLSGMKELISHLVIVHKCRRLAFIRGPEGNEEAELRLKIVGDVLKSHGLELHSELIVPGDFNRDSGENAIEHLVDKCSASFDAVVAANDDMALGALKALQERHIMVPDKMIVVGFDDIEECSYTIPSMTTVRQQTYELGSRAAGMVIDKIEGHAIPDNVVLPAALEVRQSCGCHRFGESADVQNIRIKSDTHLGRRELLRNEIKTVLEPFRNKTVRETLTVNDINELTDAFFNELTGGCRESFISVIRSVVWRVGSEGGDVSAILRIIPVLRQVAESFFSQNIPSNIEDIIQNTSLCIADVSARVQALRRMEADSRSAKLRDAGQSLASAYDLKQLLNVIRTEVVKLNVKSCWLSLYKNPSMSLKEYVCVLMVVDGKKVDGDEISFSNANIVPPGHLTIDKPESFLVEPLFFKNEQIGFITFQIGECRDGMVYEMLRKHISSALKGAILMKKVQEQALALESANHQLQKLRDAEHAYLEAIKHELELGRDIQGSFLPREMPEIIGYEVCNAFSPAREVSGDFYDVFTIAPGQVALVIADVSGKDVSAALYMALIRTLIRSLSEIQYASNINPLKSVELSNKYLINHHYGNNGRYMYATLFMAILDTRTNTISYINAGHNPPALVSKSGGVRKWISPTGPAVGIIPDATFDQNSIFIESGEMLFLYTDGVTEARDPDGTLFSKGKLAGILDSPFGSAKEAISSVESSVNEHCQGLAPHDDITMLVLRRSV